MMSKYFWLLSLLLLIMLPVVSAGLVVTPDVGGNVSVFMGTPGVFGVRLFNDNNFSVYNVSFSGVQDFEFPVIPVLSGGEVRDVEFVVSTGDVYDVLRVSSVSYFYLVDVNLSSSVYVVNITSGGFVPSNLSIVRGDNVSWVNMLNVSADVRDLGSGFQGFVVPFTDSVMKKYDVEGGFLFFDYPLGFVGGLEVSNRSGVFVHDSARDVAVTFSVRSSLNPSVLFFDVLNSELLVNWNGTQSGVLEVSNRGVDDLLLSLSVNSSWVSFVGDKVFVLGGGVNKLVGFNVSPSINSTGESNKSYSLLFGVESSGLKLNDSLSVRVGFRDFDTFTVNGTTYVINRLGVNDTILFCLANPGDIECRGLIENFTRDKEVVRVISANATISEDELKTMVSGAGQVGDTVSRLENSLNRQLSFEEDLLLKVDNNSNHISNISADNEAFKLLQEEVLRKSRNRTTFWVIVGFLLLIGGVVFWVWELYEEWKIKVKMMQE